MNESILEQARKLFQNKQYLHCVELVERNIENAPHHDIPKILVLLGDAHQQLDNNEQAITYYRQALTLNPLDERAYFHLAQSYSNLNQHEDEILVYKEALSHFPNHFNFNLNLAFVYFFLRKLDLAKSCYQNMIKIDPKSTMAYRNMGLCFTYEQEDNPDAKKLIQLLSIPDISREDVMQGHFALGKIYQDCHNYTKTFFHYQEANAIYANRRSFKVQEHINYISYFIKTFDNDFFKNLNFEPNLSDKPIFVIGLPRAGKSLVENVIASNTSAYNADEVAAFEKIAMRNIGKFDVKQYFINNNNGSDGQFWQKLSKDYLEILNRNVPPDVKRIIDTTPTNYLFMGLIRVMFPNAKIIHCTRAPLDQCLQIYFKCFGEGNDYSYNLSKLGHYYLQYKRLMKHWCETLGIEIFEVKYEELVLKHEATVQRIFNYIELPHENHVNTFLDPYKKALYSQEIGYWKHYDQYLDILKNILKQEQELNN